MELQIMTKVIYPNVVHTVLQLLACLLHHVLCNSFSWLCFKKMLKISDG